MIKIKVAKIDIGRLIQEKTVLVPFITFHISITVKLMKFGKFLNDTTVQL